MVKLVIRAPASEMSGALFLFLLCPSVCTCVRLYVCLSVCPKYIVTSKSQKLFNIHERNFTQLLTIICSCAYPFFLKNEQLFLRKISVFCLKNHKFWKSNFVSSNIQKLFNQHQWNLHCFFNIICCCAYPIFMKIEHFIFGWKLCVFVWKSQILRIQF